MRLLLVPLFTALCLAQPADLLLKGGHVIDPRNSIDARKDVLIQDGRIAAVEDSIDASRARRAIDVAGLYVTPGLVDIHTHLFSTTGIPDAWAGDNSVRPDDFSFRTGVTTMVDAGSSGWRNFETFRHTVIGRASTRVLAMINIAGLGMLTDVVEQEPSDMRPEEVARLARKHKDIVVGVKTAHYQRPDWTSVDRALEAGKLAGLPVMVDFGHFLPERPFWRLVTERLRPGDIATHMFRGPVPWLDADGRVYEYLRLARRRGVKFDTGHGGGSFVLRNAAPATAQGFYPDAISTDLHTGSMNGTMMDLPTTMSKFLALGMPLNEAILRSTWMPAQIVGRTELGHLSAGAAADVAVWNLMEGSFAFADAEGGRIEGRRRLLCELTLREGRIAWNWNARGTTDWRRLPADYGVRKGVDSIVAPPRN
ncbi:MAG: amidohydrolase/deacetylase family metallohydrolase [Acidobacteria bacterium]|nr:amidohydrolase/deacetylase family metallohydrolase [Acidobacteriota bacterium]